MEIKKRRSYKNKTVKHIYCKECGYKDIINRDNEYLRSKTWVVGDILRARTKHITYSVDRHTKADIVYGMATDIFFEMMRIIIEELFNRNTISLKYIGDIVLESNPVNVKYRGWRDDRKRAKNNGFYTMIKLNYKGRLKSKYGFPYWAFGETYKKRLHQMEDKGIKF